MRPPGLACASYLRLPANVTIAGSATRVAAGGSTAIGGTVTAASGDALPGRRVVLLRRGPFRWRPVGQATSDAAGHVSIATPAITATSRFRLRTGHHVASVKWRVVEVPGLSASANRSGTTVTVSATAQGARAGDRVVLFRRAHGRLVRLRHGRLDAGGSVSFAVKARPTRTTYVVRLPATRKHAPASATVTVPGCAADVEAHRKAPHPGLRPQLTIVAPLRAGVEAARSPSDGSR